MGIPYQSEGRLSPGHCFRPISLLMQPERATEVVGSSAWVCATQLLPPLMWVPWCSSQGATWGVKQQMGDGSFSTSLCVSNKPVCSLLSSDGWCEASKGLLGEEDHCVLCYLSGCFGRSSAAQGRQSWKLGMPQPACSQRCPT